MKDGKPSGIEWFKNAGFGLFVHYGLYSLPGRGEWVQFYEKIPVGEYAKLMDGFTAVRFDADMITDLALEAEMKYVNFTTMHHDGFCLFDTKETGFNSVHSPAGRDLVAELAEQCHSKGLGLSLYYSHGRHWRHPHAMSPEKYDSTARPAYNPPEATYATGGDHDISKYVYYCKAQVTELLANYGPVSNIWFDGIGTIQSGPWETELCVPELYQHIRVLQPDCLISYKWWLTGTEDFIAPEYHWPERQPEKIARAMAKGTPIELCQHIAGWGYNSEYDGKHRGTDFVMGNLEYASRFDANLLLNIAPLPDGSIDRQDIATLREVGARLRKGDYGRN